MNLGRVARDELLFGFLHWRAPGRSWVVNAAHSTVLNVEEANRFRLIGCYFLRIRRFLKPVDPVGASGREEDRGA
jgi:hypothetical protein